MMLSRLNPAGSSAIASAEKVPFGMSSPMICEIARDSADNLIKPKAEVARRNTRKNSNDMASAVTLADVCNSVFRYPSQRSWRGTVPTTSAATSFSANKLNNNARQIADLRAEYELRFPASLTMAVSPQTTKGQRGNSRCEFSKSRRSHASHSAGWRPVVTQRLNKACLALARVRVQPLLQAATPQRVQPLAQPQMWPTAKPIQTAVTNPTTASPVYAGAQPMDSTTKARRGFGGFLMPKFTTGPSHLIAGPETEGTSDVQ
ncbi:hypothetical protein TA5114_02631 [Cognatishimia activa]|uniref:Uncharacterized protein n=1 Tax=Cognatishimia activa TaxID=1715691 RepID=A0A0P1IT88_9RHOB|nr:hypothetical protein TA5113_01460 [Cognatishimia activa]CUK26813.1 hypothetical protein TA5114_02631 [Cognatishimia activa]